MKAEAVLKKNNMRNRFTISAILLLLLLTALIGYNYVYQSHREIATETAKFEIASKDLATRFITNLKGAEATYLNITIIVSGDISEITNNNITLNEKVFCQFKTDIKSGINKNKKTKIKGRVIGYDDLLEQVKLDQCVIY